MKSKWLLERHGFEVDDRHLRTRKETEAFKSRHGVDTTPQTFIAGDRIGGYDALKKYVGARLPAANGTTYVPVIVIFATAALMSLAIGWATGRPVISIRTIEWFAAFAMTLLAVQKLRDFESFSTMFLNYDLLARRWVPYAYLYAYAEAAAGILMLGGGWLAIAGAPIALFIGTVGAISVIKAVYID
jgi:glutaredoxin